MSGVCCGLSAIAQVLADTAICIISGTIRNVTVRNVSWFHEGPVSLEGFSENNKIENVIFENCMVENQPLAEVMQRILEIGPFVEGVKIINKEAFLAPVHASELNLVLGQDISIGYESHNEKEVRLFFTESFTLQIHDPATLIMIE